MRPRAAVAGHGRVRRAARSRPRSAVGGRRRPWRCCGRGGPRPGASGVRAGVCRGRWTASTAGPPDQPGALLGDPAAVHGGVGLVVLGGQPGPRGQLRRSGEPGHVTDLGDEHRSQDRSDARDRPGPPRSRGRSASRSRTSRANRSISTSRSSISRRSESTRTAYGAGNASRSNSRVRPDPEQVADRDLDPALGQHRVDLRLADDRRSRPAWPGAGPARAAPASPAARSTPPAADPSAAGQPDRWHRGRRSSPAGT